MRPEFQKANAETVLRLLAADQRVMELPLKMRNTLAFYLTEMVKSRGMSVLGLATALEVLLEETAKIAAKPEAGVNSTE